MRSRWRGLAGLSLLLLLVACRREFAVCARPEDCRQNQACVRGTCTAVSDRIGDASPDLVSDRPRADGLEAALVPGACETKVQPLGLVASSKLRAGKATGIALDGTRLFMSAHGLSLTTVPGATHPCPTVTSAGIASTGIIEQFDIADPFDPISRGATCLADVDAQEVWGLAAEGGDVYAAGDYLGLVGYRVASGGIVGARPGASQTPPLPAPDVSPTSLPSDTCGWIPGLGTRAPAAIALAIASPPGWSKRIGVVGYLYCNLFGIYDLSALEAGTIPVLAYYRSASPATGYVNSTIAAVWGERSDRFYALTTVYALDGTWSYQFEVVQMESPRVAPRRLGAVTISRPVGGGVGSLAASGRYVYWAASEAEPHSGGLRIFDVSDGSSPELVGRLDIPHAGAMPWKGSSLAVSGATVSFAAADGLHMIDVSDPRKPSSSGQAFYPWPEAFGTCHGGYPILVGDYAYVAVNCYPGVSDLEAAGTGGLAIYRVRTPRQMTCDGQCVNVEDSHSHCGGCHQACSPYQRCVQGVCISH